MGRTNRGGVAGGEGEGEEVHSRRRRQQQGGELGDGVADLLRDGLRGVGLERGEEVRLERGLAGGGELRPRGGNLRILFAFDPRRMAILLIGGDKTNRWEAWYREFIPIADGLYDEHLDMLRKEGLLP